MKSNLGIKNEFQNYQGFLDSYEWNKSKFEDICDKENHIEKLGNIENVVELQS